MSGCQTCGGFGNRHDPIAHDEGQDRMTAVEFSPQERARLDAIEAAEPAPESLRERMVEAVAVSFAKQLANGYVDRGQCQAAADAALAVIKGDPS